MTIDGYCTVGVDREYDLAADDLVNGMDRSDVERAVIVSVDRLLAVHNREGNDLLLDAANQYPDRLIPGCAANPWYGAEAVKEARRAIRDGARMLVLHPFVQGFIANDDLGFPLIEVAAAESIPVYIHTGTENATPWQVVDLADRFPTVDFVMGHCGATDYWNDVPEAGLAADNVYLESSLARPFSFCRHLDRVGSRKGVMGSYAPLNELGFEWDQMRQTLPSKMHAEVLGRNLQRLLEKRGPL